MTRRWTRGRCLGSAKTTGESLSWGLTVLLVVCTLLSPVLLAPPAARAQGQLRGAAAQSEGPVDLGLYDVPIRFVGDESTTHRLTGGLDGGDDAQSYPGTVEFRAAGDGLTVINDVTMASYVEGLAEVPLRWPSAALKAQAVAARTYAWYSMGLGTFAQRGYDICATVACQVYSGREHTSGPQGDRWRDAVAATAGEVITSDGRPILARYHSTSGGRTRPNDAVFPDEGPVPYLKGVDDPHDAVSPLHRWTVAFTHEQLNAILTEGETLGRAVPVADLEVVDGERARADRVRATGRDGATATVPASAFRRFVSTVAEQLFPDRFPTARSDGRPLPMTLPSSRFRFEVTDQRVVVHGRGFGHGVGMSQYGAMGQALAGVGYRDILAHYYNGLRPSRPPTVPERVRVGLATSGQRFDVSAPHPMRIVAGDRVITERGLGTWVVTTGPRGTMRLSAPSGYGAPLVVSPTTAADTDPATTQVVAFETVVNKPVELILSVVADDGRRVLDRSVEVVDAGRHRLRWDLDDAAGNAVAPGRYQVMVQAVDETGAREGEPVDVLIHGPAGGASPASMLAELEVSRGLPGDRLLAAVVGLAAGGALAVLRYRLLVARRAATGGEPA